LKSQKNSVSEQNKAIARRYEAGVHSKDYASAIEELIASDYVLRGPGLPIEMAPGREGFKQLIAGYLNVFTDQSVSIDDLIAEGDKVAMRWTFHATHSGWVEGIAPTGRRVTWTGISILEIAGGKIAKSWVISDGVGRLQQLGVIPLGAAGTGAIPIAKPELARQHVGQGSKRALPVSKEEREAFLSVLRGDLCKNLYVRDDLFSPDYRFYRPASPEPLNRDGYKRVSRAYQGVAFPDWSCTVEEVIAEDDKVVTRVILRGTHKGDFLGIPPTGKTISVAGVSIFRIAHGKIAEHWVQSDAVGLMRQLGFDPALRQARK